ncbi:hypothetical protein NPX13_g1325 [Xylaria arbuscula]|uniref:Uncharacterized protein n=1 Tax=Xylaria arbuscula TaxID=114810 RepID=A0A9W8TRC7_9PEZI|nr:hypothetical protein NPX13_g1325 [Xylaria arbuscula]
MDGRTWRKKRRQKEGREIPSRNARLTCSERSEGHPWSQERDGDNGVTGMQVHGLVMSRICPPTAQLADTREEDARYHAVSGISAGAAVQRNVVSPRSDMKTDIVAARRHRWEIAYSGRY